MRSGEPNLWLICHPHTTHTNHSMTVSAPDRVNRCGFSSTRESDGAPDPEVVAAPGAVRVRLEHEPAFAAASATIASGSAPEALRLASTCGTA